MVIFHWFLTFTGTNDEGGTWYGFWSGFGGAIPDFLLQFNVFIIHDDLRFFVRGPSPHQ